MVNLLTSLILAAWVVAIAILSVQNATSITIQFLFFRSIEIPFGIVLASCVAIGMLGMALLLPIWRSNSRLRAGTTRDYISDENYTAPSDEGEEW